MKILLLNYEFPPLGGGAGNATYYLLKELARSGNIQVTLVTSSGGSYKKERFSERITIHYLDIGKDGKNPHFQTQKDLLAYSWKAYWFCKALCAKEKYDLIHAFFGIPCGYVAMKLKLPYIVSLRGSDVPFYNKRFRWLDIFVFRKLSRKIWQRAASVVANSEDLRQLACRAAPHVPISIIKNGVDTEEFHPETRTGDSFVVLSTSRLIKRKGITYLLEAFLKLQQRYPASTLLLAGDGDMKAQLQEAVLESGIEEKVKFLGAVPHAKMPALYRRADVFVLPSLNEGMSNSLLEAMASGLAIVATDTGGVKELLGEECGSIVRKEHSKDIFLALERLYNNRDELQRMKQKSREQAERMSWKKTAEEYIRAYDMVE